MCFLSRAVHSKLIVGVSDLDKEIELELLGKKGIVFRWEVEYV